MKAALDGEQRLETEQRRLVRMADELEQASRYLRDICDTNPEAAE